VLVAHEQTDDKADVVLLNGYKPSNDPLHGLTLEVILSRLVEHLGWTALGKRIKIRCFTLTPSLQSSLKFLRRTPWARKKVEELYLKSHCQPRQSLSKP